jgi:methanogenic corrinoid protein MtbC1
MTVLTGQLLSPTPRSNGRDRRADRSDIPPNHDTPPKDDVLCGTIKSAIIPRLSQAHAGAKESRTMDSAAPPTYSREALALAEKLLDPATTDTDICDHVVALRAGGLSDSTIMLDVLSGAARLLGDDWCFDRAHFVEVTCGLSKLFSAQRALSSDFIAQGRPGDVRGQILMADLACEQHSFGACMAADFLRRDGWSVTVAQAEAAGCTNAERVAEFAFDAVGFTLSRAECWTDLRDEIAAVRTASCNPDVAVFVGGNAFLENPALADSVGADMMASDGHDAVIKMRSYGLIPTAV